MMKSFRLERLQNEIKKILNNALSTKLNDPRLEWVIVSEVIISKDLKYAKVYFTHYNNPLPHEQIKELLNIASGFFKKQIAGAKLMRTIPEITYFYDETEERAAKVDALLAKVKDDFDDDDDYDPDIDIDDYLDDDELFDIDEEEEDITDIDDLDEEDDI
ncbi:MAG: 30S ribosome-binding factor RbfA [Candidatus Cloacimonadaceae bacterium]